MMNGHPETNPRNDLRHKAEERLKDSKSCLDDLAAEEGRDALALVHELQVHQVELEMQNEELKRSKLEAEDALAQYSDLYDFAPIGLFTLDAKGLIQEVNLAGAALLGHERRNLIHRQFRRFVDAKSRSSFGDFCRKAFETCIKQKCELNLLRNGEPSVYARVEGTAAEEGSLNKKQFRIAAIDITERKRSEEELRETRDYLESLINYANAPIVVWDPKFKITRFNNAFKRLTGHSAAEVLGAPLNILFPASSRDESLEHIRRTLSGERWDAVEIPILKKDGSIRTVLWNSANICSGNGSTVIATIAQGQDITDRKLAEEGLRRARDELDLRVQERTSELQKINETLQESEERFRKSFEQSPIGAAMVALDYKYLRINPAYCRIMGYSREELCSLTFANLTYPDDLEADLKQARRLAKGEIDQYQMDKRYIRKDGKIIWGHLSVSTVKDASGRPLYFIPMIEDITERKNVEIALREAKDAAEAAAQAKSDFLANMSHEIRTPMNAVIGMTSILLDEDLTPEHRDFVETIRTSGDALMVIINDILDFSKMDREKTTLEAQPFDLRSCIEESIDLIAVLAKEKMLNLAYEIDKNVPQIISGDPTRLRQVLVNLLNNAIKFTNTGEVKLSVSDQAFSDIHEIHFAVQDTGIGISPEDIEKLFKPFSQVETSATRHYGGTGLGLAISKKLVELMGGRVWFESEPGKGSTFHFTIRTTTASDEKEQLLKIIQPRLVGKHVLIVEDNKTNRRILGLQTYSWGMVPMIASSGEDALSWIQRGDCFDLAIIDESLEDIDGLALAKEMRKFQRDLPIVLLTSLGHHETFDIFSAILSKPIKPAQLYAILLELLAKKPRNGSYQADDKRPAMAQSPLILLAEDNTSSQKVIMAMLKRLGYRADAVANGIEALQALDRQHYEIVLMDIKMPEMGGLDATKIIRQRWPDNGPKVIAVTAFALEGDKKRCLDSGMDDYISKPVKIGELAEVLRKYLPTH